MKRECGGCTLCCRLVPVKSLNKPALQRCQHQRTGKGCAIYHQPDNGFPRECHWWNCAWLVGEDTGRRPDRAHLVVDVVPDYVISAMPDGKQESIAVIQIWADPKHPDAHRDPELRAWLERHSGYAALVRFGNDNAILLVPPGMNDQGVWIEKTSNLRREHTHSFAQIAAVLGGAPPERVQQLPP